jgi:hypothetical protein
MDDGGRMKTNQTAMQELIKEMESLKTNKPYVNPQNALRDCISLAYLKLSMEKEQITKAVDVGFEEGSKFPEDIKLNNAEEYYNETYGGDK